MLERRVFENKLYVDPTSTLKAKAIDRARQDRQLQYSTYVTLPFICRTLNLFPFFLAESGHEISWRQSLTIYITQAKS